MNNNHPKHTTHVPHSPEIGRILAAFLARDFFTEISYRAAFLTSIGGILFRVFIFYFLAQLIGQTASPLLETYNGDYFSFVLIGLALGSYFGVGLTGFARALRESQTTGTLEAMLMTPAPVSIIITGSAVWSYTFTTFRVFIYLLTGSLLLGVRLNHANIPAALLILVLGIISFASIGIVAAAIIMIIKRGDPITTLLGNLANLVSGVYYPLEVLPGWLQAIAHLLPLTYALRGLRLALLAGADWATLWPDIRALLGFCVVLFPLSLLLFGMAVQRARAEGSLAQF
ncbi:MAG: ABC transporter permease [Chloroflexi bacterium]|nr:MAG: ABC transporter permease [Chloroflexota bacterium]